MRRGCIIDVLQNIISICGCRHIGRHTNSPGPTWFMIAVDWNASQFRHCLGHRSSNLPRPTRGTIWHDHCQSTLWKPAGFIKGCFPTFTFKCKRRTTSHYRSTQCRCSNYFLHFLPPIWMPQRNAQYPNLRTGSCSLHRRMVRDRHFHSLCTVKILACNRVLSTFLCHLDSHNAQRAAGAQATNQRVVCLQSPRSMPLRRASQRH